MSAAPPPPSPPAPGRLLYRIEIDAPPDDVWRAITNPEWTRRFFHDTAVHTTWTPGTPISYDLPDGTPAIAGRVLEYSPPRRFVMTARFLFDDEAIAEPESLVTWEVVPQDRGTRLTLLHDRVPAHTITFVRGGWPGILEDLHRTLRPGAQPRIIAS
jgi:uncharacterized protein YndB with AHSA1/START domain